ncbi:hypothetical protein TYRP_011882 [Tyrophagus putrescentiae]|nr:hypothetical protein TYRP_011882 [Tyrophagus putrescentiae]
MHCIFFLATDHFAGWLAVKGTTRNELLPFQLADRERWTLETVIKGASRAGASKPWSSAPASRSGRSPFARHRGLSQLHGVHEAEETYFNRSLEQQQQQTL